MPRVSPALPLGNFKWSDSVAVHTKTDEIITVTGMGVNGINRKMIYISVLICVCQDWPHILTENCKMGNINKSGGKNYGFFPKRVLQFFSRCANIIFMF